MLNLVPYFVSSLGKLPDNFPNERSVVSSTEHSWENVSLCEAARIAPTGNIISLCRGIFPRNLQNTAQVQKTG